ncbi:MAG: hypothetical protein R2746_03275 [Acidimicrobiales bacterium]
MEAGCTRDTSPDVADLMLARWRTMSPAERATVADHLSIDVATLAEAGTLAQRPTLTGVALRHELARRRYGAALADAAFSDPGDE